MAIFKLVGTISDTSPAATGTAVSAVTVGRLESFSDIIVVATLTGATGDTLDVYLQRELATNVWADWVHFAQIAAAAAAASYVIHPQKNNTIVTVGVGTTAAPGVALAANTCAGGHPGSNVRAVYVAAASTSAGATQTIRILGRK